MVSIDPDPNRAPAVHLTRAGVLQGISRLFPIAVFVIPFGLAFGVAALDAGMSPSGALAMSVVVFSGAAQFAALDFWGEPVVFGSLAFVVLALNARHVIMGAALAPWVNRLPPWQRVLSLAYLSDPNFADSQTAFKSGGAEIGRLLGGGLILWLNWIVGTAIGVLGGGLLGAPERFGIDVVMACFFTAVVTEQLRESRTAILPFLVAAVVSVVSLPWLATGWNVILGALAAGIVGIAAGGPDTDRAENG